MQNTEPHITYCPLTDALGKISGIHAHIHAADLSGAELAKEMGVLHDVWPRDDSLTLAEFVNRDSSVWLKGWIPGGNTCLVTDSTMIVRDPAYNAIKPGPPKLCVLAQSAPKLGIAQVSYLGGAADSLNRFAQISAEFPNTGLLAVNVNQPGEYQAAMQYGATLCSGWSLLFQAVDPANTDVGLLNSLLTVLNMIDDEADVAAISNALKRDAVLTYKLLAQVNSAALALPVKVTSIQHAIAVLGMHRLKHWLSALILHCGDKNASPLLMHTSYTRGVFLEAIGKANELNAGCHDLFLCGAFSLLDKILGISFEEILSKVNIPQSVSNALIAHEGPYADMLSLAESVELKDVTKLKTLSNHLSLDGSTINRALLSSIRAANELAAA